jgi:CRP/FNR family transcriptional regulator, cyclic AMP receptor protein
VRIRRDAKVELMSKVPLFSGCSKKHVAEIAKVADEIHLREGKVLTTEGKPGREFFILLDGRADVRKKGRKVATLTKGDFFGEVALVSDRPRNATVVATTPVRALVVTDRAFRSLLKQSPAIQAQVLEAVVERISGDNL